MAETTELTELHPRPHLWNIRDEIILLTSPARHPCYPGSPSAGFGPAMGGIKADAWAFPSGQKDQQLRLSFRPYVWVRLRCSPQPCSAHLADLCQETMCFGLPLTPPSSYMGELPNSHGRPLINEPYVMHGILSGTGTMVLI
jgi:hypothetical protein